MAKNKKQKTVQQPLTAENYIKTRGRSLPLFECLVNEGWQEDKLAYIIISRKHTNGNITMCSYLVDLYCVGVKQSLYMFNISFSNYLEIIQKNKKLNLQPIDYVLAHNIIFAGLEYAETLGILPHKDFLKVTECFLEENSVKIEYMEIECGRKGKPFFVADDFYTLPQSNSIMKQLEKSVGKGNFDYLFEVDSNQYEENLGNEKEQENEEIEDDLYRYYDNLKPIDRAELFNKMIKEGYEFKDKEHLEKLIKLANNIYIRDVCDLKVVDSYLHFWKKTFILPIEDVYLVESLNLNPDVEVEEKMFETLGLVTQEISEDSNKVNQKVKNLIKAYSDNPYFCYLDLKLIEKEGNEKKYAKEVEKYFSQFPNNPLLKIENFRNRLKQKLKVSDFDILPHKIFENRTGITPFEMYQYLLLKMAVECKPGSFNILQAIEDWSLELPIYDNYKNEFLFFNQMLKVDSLKLHFKTNS